VDDACVDWSQPAVRRGPPGLARARLNPGAWTTYAGERLKLGPVALLADDTSLAPGGSRSTRTGSASGRRPTRSSRRGRAQGKKAMAAADWARGVRPEPGVLLGADVPT
jgi:methionyl-tRNA formyltransferase